MKKEEVTTHKIKYLFFEIELIFTFFKTLFLIVVCELLENQEHFVEMMYALRMH